MTDRRASDEEIQEAAYLFASRIWDALVDFMRTPADDEVVVPPHWLIDWENLGTLSQTNFANVLVMHTFEDIITTMARIARNETADRN